MPKGRSANLTQLNLLLEKMRTELPERRVLQMEGSTALVTVHMVWGIPIQMQLSCVIQCWCVFASAQCWITDNLQRGRDLLNDLLELIYDY